MQGSSRRRIWIVCAAVVVAALVLPLGARVGARHFHDDTLWANTLGSLGGSGESFDFDIFLGAGDDVLAGRSPYPKPEALEGQLGSPYAYPPLLALLVTPLAVLPETVADTFVPGVVFTLLLIAATVGALGLLGVRDWRCYPVALLYPVTLEAFEYGAIGPVLLFLLALAWRFRDDSVGSGVATGGAVVLKLFLWPSLVWLAVTRRLRAAALGAVAAAALALLSWSVIGFSGLAGYPRLLRRLVENEAENSYSGFAVLRAIGLPELASHALVLAGGVALLVLAGRAARTPALESVEQDRRSLTLTLAAALVLTPILWLHYLVLLVLPIALARPRLSLLWFAPLAMTAFEWLDWYRGWPNGDSEALASVSAVVVLVFAVSLRRSGSPADESRSAPARA
ncbi:MAG: hypothetical protein A2146_08350 [Actinobacteria bacterium RBG_16_67_10]|nr:MAG: hypothetical protein A2146_08350 [Actinobacteria bacterium RBG_16_67_10]